MAVDETQNKPSICFMLPRTGHAGTERHVLSLATGLRDRGFGARIVCLFEEGSLAQEVRKAGIPLVCLGETHGWGPSTMFRLFRSLRTHRVDILHTYLFGFHAFAGLPARILKIPVILSSRREIALWKTLRHRCLENFGNLFVDRVICCSQAVQQWTREHEKIPPETLLTIYNGVDCNWFKNNSDGLQVRQRLGITQKDSVIGTVANFGAEKGYSHLLQAADMVLKDMPSGWFLFVGSGPLLEEMKEKAKRISRPDRIVIAGRQQDVR